MAPTAGLESFGLYSGSSRRNWDLPRQGEPLLPFGRGV